KTSARSLVLGSGATLAAKPGFCLEWENGWIFCAMGFSQSCDIAVVGLGAMGSAALYQLAKRGVKAIGIDRFAPPHDQGSTHGETRITRQAIGEGEVYVPLALRSHEIWKEL